MYDYDYGSGYQSASSMGTGFGIAYLVFLLVFYALIRDCWYEWMAILITMFTNR